MPISDPDLWAAIRDWPLPNATVERGLFHRRTETVTFAEGLTEGGRLLSSSAEGVEAEYRRWLYLCCLSECRLQGSDWIAAAEAAHRKDAANWQAFCARFLPDGLPPGPVTRTPDNDDDYAETLARYSGEFPEGTVFPKLWPELYQIRAQRLHIRGICVFLTTLAAIPAISATGVLQVVGIVGAVFGIIGLGVADVILPWTGDEEGA